MRRPPRPGPTTSDPRPPPTLTPALLERSAAWHLARRSMTTGELRVALQKKAARHPPHADSGAWIEALLSRFAAGALLDDARVARARVETGRNRGWSRRRIEQKLRGVDADVRTDAFTSVDEAAASPVGEDVEPLENAELRAARVFVARKRLSEKPPEKALAALARQGFSYGVARAALTPR